MNNEIPKDTLSLSLNAVNESRKAESLIEQSHYAKWMCERLVKTINNFESNLPDDMQAGGRLVSSGDYVFSIDDIGYWNPDLIIFYGSLPGNSAIQLVQSTSQVNLVLVAVKRKDNLSHPRREIGFHMQE